MNCVEILKTTFFLYSSEVPQLLYYSHVPAVVAALFLGLWIYFSAKKRIEAKVFLAVTILFTLLSLFNLVTWTNSNSDIMSVYWILTMEIFNWLMFSLAYFFYVFVNKKDASLTFKAISVVSLVLSPLILLSRYGVSHFDINFCELSINYSYYYYQIFINCLAFIYIIVTYIKDLLSNSKRNSRTDSVSFVATILFTGFFLSTWHLSSFFDVFIYEQIAYVGSIIFLVLISYSIVRFKAFDIKLIGAQALVWALVILIGSQFFFIQNDVNRILTAITLVISAVVGLIIIRSVKKEVAQREELAVANENQQLLIRFITHQVKGFFTKSKMVFASLLEGDFGQIPEAITPVLKEGLESDNKAVEMVQEVLKASSLRSGTMTYDFVETDLKEFVGGIAETFKDTATGKGLAYEINLPAEKALSKIDRLQLTQVIKNLIDNSVKYTLTGFVHVNLKIKNSNEGRRNIKTALFSVEDSGVGLSDGDKAKLFKEGGRGEESLKVNVNSTGYGLFIVKKIVEGHGGKIWAESKGRGHGSRFYVELPLVESSLK